MHRLASAWSRIGLVWNVVLVTGAMGALVLLLSAAALIHNARSAIGVEVTYGQRLARDYVIAAVGSLMRGNNPEMAVAFLPGTLFQPRHVQISVLDHVRGITHFPREKTQSAEFEAAPDWFHALLSPAARELRIPISVGPDTFGTVIITTDPADEINEVWEDFRLLGMIGAVAHISTLLILMLVLRATLRPLKTMAVTFFEVEAGDHAARIGKMRTPEFAPLARRFDSLAETVQTTLAEKDALNRRLLELQDEERRAVAMELHDEYGPSLFCLRVEARAIGELANTLGSPELAQRAILLREIVEHIQTTNRALLDRLRPMELDELPLSNVLEDMLDRLRGLGPDLDWRVGIGVAADQMMDDAAKLTLYRVTQEAVTNALRHADATAIRVSLSTDPSRPDWLVLEVADDGRGWKGEEGSGIRGMRERAASAGGRLSIEPLGRSGTRVCLRLPVTMREVELAGE